MPGPASQAKSKRPRPAPPPPVRAFGRSLGDFGKLHPAERTLLKCCRAGEYAVISDERPDEETAANRVRASFVRFLALGGDERAPVHERGVLLHGAWLEGVLTLEAARIEYPLVLASCRIQRIDALRASIATLNLHASRLEEGCGADGLRSDSAILLRNGFHSLDEISITGATIGGMLDCSEGRFEGPGGVALACDALKAAGFSIRGGSAIGGIRLHGAVLAGDLDCAGAHLQNDGGPALSCDAADISGNVFLANLHALGEIRFPGVAIRNHLDCTNARIENAAGNTLLCERAAISGNLFLDDGFHSVGQIRLHNATIGGSVSLSLARLENAAGNALICDAAQIGGVLFFRELTSLQGGVDLSSVQVRFLCDDVASWNGARGRLVLDGFVYEAFAGGATTDARARIDWLHMQRADHLSDEFRPQPWEQLIGVLRAMGHPEEARRVAMDKQTQLRRSGRLKWWRRPLHLLYWLLVGYGYRPMWLLGWIALVWLSCASAYWAATNPAWFGAETHLLASPPADTASAARPPDYRNFVPLIYSADVLLPVVDLGYKDEWQPVVAERAGNPLIWGQLLRFLYWFEIAFGWVAGLLLVGVLGNLIKKD